MTYNNLNNLNNYNPPCLQGLAWNRFGNANYDLYLLDWKSKTSIEFGGYVLPWTTLYLTNEYLCGG